MPRGRPVNTVGHPTQGTTRYDPEVAAPLSGGGFSKHFERPPYQKVAMLPYLKHLKEKQPELNGMYNKGGRGIPDISAQALKFTVIFKEVSHSEDGTSCATPTVAGIISLLNDYRISIGLPPFGFLNPWRSSKGRNDLNDILTGSNPGCGTNGFSATIGWDAVTGLGTPDFLKLQENFDDEESSTESGSGSDSN